MTNADKRLMNATSATDVSQPDQDKYQVLESRLEQTARLLEETKEMLAHLRMARGTRDVKPQETYKHAELYASMVEMLKERPMKFIELRDATKALDNPIKTCLVRMQREGVGLVNLGDQARAIWFIPDPEVLERLRTVGK